MTITQQRLKELLSYNPETGRFVWLIDKGRAKAGGSAGTWDGYYLYVKLDQRRYAIHRLAWLYMMGEWPEADIDHWDTNGANNKFTNLRSVTRNFNQQNKRRANRDSKTGYLGVRMSASGKRFQALIGVDGKTLTLGHFSTPQEAHEAYVHAKRQLHPGNTL
jgi:hypothetical protein